jgi:hypothetical protein
MISWVCQDRFPHSEIFGSKLDWQLPEAYGSLPPPSSSLDTKASTKSPFQLTANLMTGRMNTKCFTYKYFKDHTQFFSQTTLRYKNSNTEENLPQILVEMSGFEPLAFRLQNGRSTN